MVPHFANPHLLPSNAEFTTRAELFRDAVKIVTPTNFTVQLSWLENLIKESIHVDVASCDNEHHDIGLPANKRRRLESKPTMSTDGSDTPPFRLISNRHSPKPIRLQPKPLPVVKSRKHLHEDDASDAERRTKQAQAAAVDCKDLIRESRQSHIPSIQPNRVRTVIPVVTPYALPALLVTEWPTLPAPLQHYRPDRPGGKMCCPVISITTSLNSIAPTSRKRNGSRRRFVTASELPLRALFWKPRFEWGGKSAGYAMGYESSWPAGQECRQTYRRDKMRRGSHIDYML